MSDVSSRLEETINKFERLLDEMKEETREAHAVLKQLHIVERSIKKLLSTDVKKLVDDESSVIIRAELEKLGPSLREQTNHIYDRVGREVDKIIDLCMGKEFATANNREDLRPELAAKLRLWLKEIIDEA